MKSFPDGKTPTEVRADKEKELIYKFLKLFSEINKMNQDTQNVRISSADLIEMKTLIDSLIQKVNK
jgi:hypothetical protein